MAGASRRWTAAHSFATRLLAWSVAWFALVRLEWFESQVLLPLTLAQGRIARNLFGGAAPPVDVTLACSGADVIALCLGALCAYPSTWLLRAAGAGGGLALVLGLNTLRIGSLGRVAASSPWFETLHVYVWPLILTLAVGAYVLLWFQITDRGIWHRLDGKALWTFAPQTTRRFVLLAAICIIVFSAFSPLLFQSAAVLSIATFVASTAATLLHVVGIEATAVNNVLWTDHGGVMVTQECVSTPLIPLYAAIVLVYSRTWDRRIAALLAALPIFVGLAIARLLVIALPPMLVTSPLWLIHASYQLLLGVAIVCMAACWRHRHYGVAARHAVVSILLGIACVYAIGPASPILLSMGATIDDPQGAIAFLPRFQIGLYVALWLTAFAGFGWRMFVGGLALLVVTQILFVFGLLVLAGEFGLSPRVADVRAWAVIGPLFVLLLLYVASRDRMHNLPHGRGDLAHAE